MIPIVIVLTLLGANPIRAQVPTDPLPVDLQVDLTTVTNATFQQTIAASRCKIEGFKLYYANTANYIQYLDTDLVGNVPGTTFRDNPIDIVSGFTICYETNQLSIEAVVTDSPECSSAISSVQFSWPVTPPNQGRKFRDRPEAVAPFFAWGNWKTQISGRVLDIGAYQLSVAPINNPSQATSIDFDVFECGRTNTWYPDNECQTCIAGEQNCLATICVDSGYLSFNLVLSGTTNVDMDLIVTAPNGDEHQFDYFIDSATTGAYPYGNGYGFACNGSNQKWVKSIVYPFKDKAPKGTYKIEVQYRDWCTPGSDGSLVDIGGPKFELQIDNQDSIQSTIFTDSAFGAIKKFEYTLL